MDPKCLIPGDATLIENIVNYLKAKGIFDEFRHECLADVDTKSSCQNLSQRVDGYASKFLTNETWHPDLNKNELRNKLRRHIDEAGFLAPGADIVVEQAINPKIYHYFLPKVIEVVHQYVKEQTELLNKKPEAVSTHRSSSISEKPVNDAFENKDKTQITDPIADILSFSFPTKAESVQHKHGDIPKMEKKKEEKCNSTTEKNPSEIQSEVITTSVNETKMQLDREKDKIKKEDPEIQPEMIKKAVKDEVKSEKKKADDPKVSIDEITSTSEENKLNMPTSSKPNVSSKSYDKHKHKFKSQNTQKNSSTSNEIKKPKKESSEKSSDKFNKTKHMKSSKESLSPTKTSSSHKSVFKEEKGESSKARSHDASTSKTSESSVKRSKSSHDKKDSSHSKHKGHSEKTDRLKAPKSVDKNEHHIHHESNSEKGSKNVQYSSSYDSSQGSDQEKTTSTSTKKEKSKHFSKHATKEKSEQPDSSIKTDKKRSNNKDENLSKKSKNEMNAKLKLKDASTIEAAKISSRSNSFGSTSSVSSSSNASKDILTSNSDEVSENSIKDKKKKQSKEKDSCQSSPRTLPPPPPPPPPSSSLTSEVTSSAEMSSMEDTQSSVSESDASSSEVISEEESGSDLELECKDLINDTLNESALNSSTDNINAFYDIFLYSSSSSEFEGYGNSPSKRNALENELDNIRESDVSISSVHTSDLSSFDDELSSDDEVALMTGGVKKRLTLKEAKELIENRACLTEDKQVKAKSCVGENSVTEGSSQKSSSVLSSDEDESPPSEPVRLLRRERKLNPRYSSSEYTSIFNCKKETFITKQSSPPVKNQVSSPKTETKLKKTDSSTDNNKNLTQDKNIKVHSDESDKNKSKLKKESQNKSDELNDSKISGSDEAEAIMDKEKLFKENNKNNLIVDDDKLKDHKKLRPHNNSKVRRNSHSLKRKLEITESTPVKRPCSRSSVDSSSSEFTPNENKPFNSEKKDFNEEKKLSDCGLKESNLNIDVKKELFNKQRTNNNGDILGQKDVFSKNSHNKVINTEKKTSESDASNELNSL